ncbi:hypothetical protein, partial [Sulfuricella sp. T08]|uniref:hypothetical protein n=1 Tax=Sulfuricella sp. T08 TaxID=1632857 RepID=UPI001ED9BE2C
AAKLSCFMGNFSRLMMSAILQVQELVQGFPKDRARIMRLAVSIVFPLMLIAFGGIPNNAPN